VLRSATGAPGATFERANGFVDALRQAMRDAQNIERLYAIWEQNVETVRALNRCRTQNGTVAPKLVAYLRDCAIAFVKDANKGGSDELNEDVSETVAAEQGPPSGIDKSVLTLSEPKRIRSKEHLRFVARQPCVICGRAPSHAHHVRFAQSKGLGLKVSDEFTVPLCAIHHQQNHTTGNERLWWQEHKIDPLAVAARLWRESQQLPAPKP
jgi:hypothetical protein